MSALDKILKRLKRLTDEEVVDITSYTSEISVDQYICIRGFDDVNPADKYFAIIGDCEVHIFNDQYDYVVSKGLFGECFVLVK